jgi:hypothetical protein
MQLPSSQQAKLLAGDKASDDNFGTSVALSSDGNTALIGAYNESDSGTSGNGAVYVFTRSGSSWSQQAKLLAGDKASGDRFGYSVALSSDGNTALIGASLENDSGTSGNGAAYVFTRAVSTWSQQAKLLAADKATSDNFGYSVALSSDGNTALIGARYTSDSGTFSNGAAYVFTFSVGIWSQQQKLLASDKATGDLFGYSVALSSDGNTALIGAYSKSDSPTFGNGAAYVFTRNASVWSQQQKLLTSDKADNDQFGISVALSGDGNTALIGARSKSDSPTSGNGAAYVFTRNAGVWSQQQKLLASDKADADFFGWSVALSNDGNTALIGAYYKTDSPTAENGAAYIFTRNANVWSQQQKLLASDKTNFDRFGSSVALSGGGDTALIGAYNTSDSGTTNNGAAYVFVDPPPATATPTFTNTATHTATFTPTATRTFTNTVTNTATATPSRTATATFTASSTATLTPSATVTPFPARPDTIGVYTNGTWYLRNTNSTGAPDITALFGGDPNDLPVVGDWNGDGMDTIGVYRNSTGFFILSNSNMTPAVNYEVLLGNPGDTPFAGRWRPDLMVGDGVAVFRPSNGILYMKRQLTSGFSDYFAVFGNPGDTGFAADWNNDGKDSIGVYRPSNTTWYGTNNNEPSGITFGDFGFVWDIGANTIPFVGDWNADGIATVGYLRTTDGLFVLHSTLATAGSDTTFPFGPANARPVAGKWTLPAGPAPQSVVIPAKPANSTNGVDGGAD